MTDPAARVVAVVQARMSSGRLPGKVLRDLGGEPVLDWVVRAARAAAGVDDIAVATSIDPSDDPIVEWGRTAGVRIVRGSLDDVLDRFVDAIDATGADAVVRLTADCPLLDPALIDQVVAKWRADPALDYVATTLRRTLPRGLDVELARAEALKESARTSTGHDRVHVTSAFYAVGSPWRTSGITNDEDHSDLRVTLDEEADAELLDAVVAILGARPPRWQDTVSVLRDNPSIAMLNGHVRQKELGEG